MRAKSKLLIVSLLTLSLFSISAFTAYKITSKKKQSDNIIPVQATPMEVPKDDFKFENASAETIKPASRIDEIIISSAGDCTLGTDDSFYKPLSLPGVFQSKGNDYSYFFKNVSSIFQSDDLTTVNLETTLTNSETKRPDRTFNFKGSPEFAKSLLSGSIEGVNLSNNHIYDYNQQGFNDTIKALQNYNINYFGENQKWVTDVKGVKFGFLGYTGWSNDTKFLQTMKKDIQSLKTEGCIVVINIHWGEEGAETPNNIQKSIAHYAVDSGADLIIGHHPHVIQGVEKYKDKYICYSLANFCFGGNSNPKDKDTFILQAKFVFTNSNFTSMGIKIIPCSVSSTPDKNDYCPTPLSGNSRSNFFARLNKLSAPLGFQCSESFSNEELK